MRSFRTAIFPCRKCAEAANRDPGASVTNAASRLQDGEGSMGKMDGAWQRSGLWMACVASAALLVGCGGGGGGDAGSAAGPNISTSTPAAIGDGPSPVATDQKGSAQLTWQPPKTNADGSPLSALAGYRVLYGKSAEDLDQSVHVPDASVLDCVIESLTPGIWYFAVVTQNSLGVEGPVSNIVSKVIL